MRTLVDSTFIGGLRVLISALDSILEPCWTGALLAGYLLASPSPWVFSLEKNVDKDPPWHVTVTCTYFPKAFQHSSILEMPSLIRALPDEARSPSLFGVPSQPTEYWDERGP